jgi:hypothetical protein
MAPVNLMLMKLENGNSSLCTHNHPVFFLFNVFMELISALMEIEPYAIEINLEAAGNLSLGNIDTINT